MKIIKEISCNITLNDKKETVNVKQLEKRIKQSLTAEDVKVKTVKVFVLRK